LFKEETISTETQEKLLLLLDNELSEGDRQQLIALIATDKTIAKEWKLLQQLKLPETASIVFEDKQSLYRTERKRVIYFDWQKLAAAAILIGIIASAGFIFLNRKDNTTTVQNISAENHPAINQSISKPITKDSNNIQQQQQNLVQQTTKKTSIKIEGQQISKKNERAIAYSTNKTVTPTNQPSQNIYADNSNKKDTSTVTLKRLNDKVDIQQNDMALNTKTDDKITPDNKNIYAVNTSLKENNLTETDNNDDRVLSVPVKKLENTKAGRLFSKIKNAGKKGIHIANIEFAIQQ
jgi:hypothetical protein